MDFFLFVLAIVVGLQFFKRREQQQRVQLLGRFLSPYQIEQQMERLLDGYLRWLGEDDPIRRDQIYGTLGTVETALAEQFERFATDAKAMPAPLAQVSKLPLWIPFAQPLLPGRLLFDVRQAFAIHARGIDAVVRNEEGRAPKARAYMLSAELLLMQHTCHWFCRGKAVATARLLARHQTPHAQVVASVSAQTRRDYLALIARR
ncbi:hypothetical protein QTH91_01540 [Variovorax dokdonensis]|uniref:Uncharacterized protein n=1 Tax=Variovorax dokdonensis TaxID=344883 RepID=A0ABT7N5E2_9BURK|nr:hypothetical protein [Variovorax dokdonensis]MDM0043153.1 hypothetical protein [Variovorax dokdonensis]